LKEVGQVAKKQAMTEIVIEKNIPIPSIGHGNGITATLKKCEVGDSFLIPINSTNLHFTAKQIGMKIKTRREGESRRVWRVS
jgi:hypothetical protein